MTIVREMLKRGWHVRVSAIGLLLIALATVLAPLIAPYSPVKPDMSALLEPPSLKHLCGTDQLGRDVLSRLIWGGRLSLSVGLIAIVIQLVFGIALGLIAGYFGGWLDDIITRLCDTVMAIPGIITSLFIVTIIGTGLVKVMIALGLSGIPGVVRLVRGSTVALREREYVLASKAAGATSAHIIYWNILPNALPPILVLTTLNLGTIILTAAGLSYIGLGAQPPSPEWGAMLTGARDFFPGAWWLSVFPGISIMIAVLFLNILGDAARDVLDPWLKEMRTSE